MGHDGGRRMAVSRIGVDSRSVVCKNAISYLGWSQLVRKLMGAIFDFAARIKVILNPYSNRGLAGQARDRITQALTRVGVEFDLVETEAGGHGMELALEACHEGYTTIVAAGGDGTISEVMNGMAQVTDAMDPVGKLGIIPIGTGNDFADMIGYPRDLDVAAQLIANGQHAHV